MLENQRYEACMLANPNTGRYQTWGSPLESSTRGWEAALSMAQVDQNKAIPFLHRNICTQWANNDQGIILSVPLKTPLRPPVLLKYSRDPADRVALKPLAAFEFTPFEF
jgi:hypothetical protein